MKIDPATLAGLRAASRMHGRTISGEVRTIIGEHLAALADDLKDDGRGDNRGRVTDPRPDEGRERVPA